MDNPIAIERNNIQTQMNIVYSLVMEAATKLDETQSDSEAKMLREELVRHEDKLYDLLYQRDMLDLEEKY